MQAKTQRTGMLKACLLKAAQKLGRTPKGEMNRELCDELARQFFTEWFVKNGHTYFFLFKKNLRVTDMQFAELHALVREALAKRTNAVLLNFATGSTFRSTIARLVSCLSEDRTRNMNGLVEFIAGHYSSMIHNTIIMEQYFGSAVLYVPQHLDLPLDTLTFVSGYIHSCGRLVYMENVYHANEADFVKRLRQFLKGVGLSNRVVFRPLSHEDFTLNEPDLKDELRSGIDDVKLWVHKQVIEGRTLSSFIEALRRKFKGKLLIPEAGNPEFVKSLPKSRERAYSLWLVRDHSLIHEGKRPGDNHFLICYEQQFINMSSFQILDENKPAWIYHTTIPHSLMAAMINITLPFWPKRGPVYLLDAFAGSGTTWFETLKYGRLKFEGSDIEPIAPLLAADNLAVFCASKAKLGEWIAAIEDISPKLSQGQGDPAKKAWMKSPNGQMYLDAKSLLGKFMSGAGNIDALDITRQKVSVLRKRDPFVRVLFYTLLKSRRRYQPALAAKAIDPERAFVNELEHLKMQLIRLEDLRTMMQGGTNRETRVTFAGLYSRGVSISPEYMERLYAEEMWRSTKVQKVENLRASSRFDVIIIDPPYGFNTIEGASALATMYCDALNLLLRALRKNGQLVLALPDWSHSGKHIPSFVLKEFVTHQVLSVAKELGLEAYQSAQPVPERKWLGGPPYYWESERALRRSILHFRFRLS